MSISATLVDSVRSTLGSRRADDIELRCPHCGSFLDAPRLNPMTRLPARKCPACAEWHPVDGPPPDRSE